MMAPSRPCSGERARRQRIHAGIPDGADVDLSLIRLPAGSSLFPATPETEKEFDVTGATGLAGAAAISEAPTRDPGLEAGGGALLRVPQRGAAPLTARAHPRADLSPARFRAAEVTRSQGEPEAMAKLMPDRARSVRKAANISATFRCLTSAVAPGDHQR
jgi:hypothetical protein